MKLKRIAPIGVSILALTVGVLFIPHPVSSYKGPGTMRDYGLLSYPRYDKNRNFTFAGVPSEEMSLQLYIVGATIDRLETPLAKLSTQITAQLFEEATPTTPRRVLCSATGSPAGASMDSRWVMTGNYTFAALWHARCLRMPMAKERRYTLTLDIVPADSSSLAKVLVPTLQGGGYELP